jgi:hypothetical protein
MIWIFIIIISILNLKIQVRKILGMGFLYEKSKWQL